jgi:MoxR-like ATPase
MQERQITIGDSTFPLEEPFLVLATQNPLDQEGTYPLPEAQVDRFLMKIVVGYPSRDEEQMIIRQNTLGMTAPEVKPVVTVKEILQARELVREVYVDEKVEHYILDIVFATRNPGDFELEDLKPLLSFGSSPRGSINLALAAKANAFLHKRGYVVPEDVRSVCVDVLRHRIGITYEAEAENVNSENVINRILDKIKMP